MRTQNFLSFTQWDLRKNRTTTFDFVSIAFQQRHQQRQQRHIASWIGAVCQMTLFYTWNHTVRVGARGLNANNLVSFCYNSGYNLFKCISIFFLSTSLVDALVSSRFLALEICHYSMKRRRRQKKTLNQPTNRNDCCYSCSLTHNIENVRFIFLHSFNLIELIKLFTWFKFNFKRVFGEQEEERKQSCSQSALWCVCVFVPFSMTSKNVAQSTSFCFVVDRFI